MLRKRIMSCVCLLMGGAALGLTMLAPPCSARTLQLEDYLQWEFVSNPRISPDGKTILYTRSRVNAAEDRFDSELWSINSDGGDNHRLMRGVSEVHWSPDGTRIAFLDTTARGPEIFVRRMDSEGGATQITREGMKPANLSWSPDGRTIAFLANVPAKTAWTITLPGKPQGAHWTDDAVALCLPMEANQSKSHTGHGVPSLEWEGRHGEDAWSGLQTAVQFCLVAIVRQMLTPNSSTHSCKPSISQIAAFARSHQTADIGE
jgi:Tol biopolymer transport system component